MKNFFEWAFWDMDWNWRPLVLFVLGFTLGWFVAILSILGA